MKYNATLIADKDYFIFYGSFLHLASDVLLYEP